MPRVVDEVVTSTVKPRAAAAVSRSLPFAIYIAFLAASPTLGPLLGDPRWLYAIQIGSVLGLLCFFARDYVELKCISSIRPADWARSLTIGILVFVAWIHLDHPALSVGNAGGFNPTLASGGVSPAEPVEPSVALTLMFTALHGLVFAAIGFTLAEFLRRFDLVHSRALMLVLLFSALCVACSSLGPMIERTSATARRLPMPARRRDFPMLPTGSGSGRRA